MRALPRRCAIAIVPYPWKARNCQSTYFNFLTMDQPMRLLVAKGTRKRSALDSFDNVLPIVVRIIYRYHFFEPFVFCFACHPGDDLCSVGAASARTRWTVGKSDLR